MISTKKPLTVPDQYKDKEDRRDDASREETAHKVARAAVKNDYEKGDDDKWHKKK